MTGIKITEDFKTQVREFYRTQPMSISTLAKHFNICSVTASRIIGNKQRYSKTILFNPNIIENFFESIDSEEKAYFLGLIIADGNIYDPNDATHKTNHKGSKWVSITLQDCDAYILKWFRDIIGLNSKIASDGRGSSYVAVRSTKLAQDLAKYGIVERKSFITYFPFNIPKHLYRHTIRGIIDGDGTIKAETKYTPSDNRNRFKHEISCCGTHRLMTEMYNLIYDTLKFDVHRDIYDYKNRLLSQFYVCNKNDMTKLGKWLYEDSHIFIQRKFDNFKKFMNHYGLIFNSPKNYKFIS